MSYKVKTIDVFEKQAKRLIKKYVSLKTELLQCSTIAKVSLLFISVISRLTITFIFFRQRKSKYNYPIKITNILLFG
jgi:hypothetical protein